MPAVRLTAPGRSNARRDLSGRPLLGTSRMPASKATSATGTGRKNVQRQPSSVNAPPNTSPNEKPVAPVAVYTDSALFRAGPSAKLVVMIDSPAGGVKAALT